jgi:hypothetical protein
MKGSNHRSFNERTESTAVEGVADALHDCDAVSDALTEAIDAYNTAMIPLWDAIEAGVDEYNGNISDLKSIYEGIADDARTYYDERSERWQEGETGQAYNQRVEQLETLDIEEIQMDRPDDIELPDGFPDFNDAEWLSADERD